jgi:V8-like Glu-specific endopeptidase
MIWPSPGAQRALAVFSIGLAVALTSIAVGVPLAGARAPWHGEAATSSAQQSRSFWTPERMRQAQPVEVRRPGTASIPASPAAEPVAAMPHRIPPRAPRAEASASSSFEKVTDPTAEEMRQNGAIFFEAEGGLYRCSGTSVNAPNFSAVITAGHCVDSGGRRGRGYTGRWIFVPGYRYGQRPFGVFPAKWLEATRGWETTGSENLDVGAAVVMRNEKGQRLADAVGGAGIAWNLKPNQIFDVHGYPAGPPFDGETQQLCPQTPFLGHDPESFLASGPLNLAVDCNVTGGASGGGWTIKGNLLNSVTDYGFPEDKATDYGAYFGKEVARLYKRAGSVK